MGSYLEVSFGILVLVDYQVVSLDLLYGVFGFVCEFGGEGELGLGGLVFLFVFFVLFNVVVFILEELQNRILVYSLEYVDLGVGYYCKYFYGKEYQNFFGMDELLGLVVVSLWWEEKEGSGGGILYSYCVIVWIMQFWIFCGIILEDVLLLGFLWGLFLRKFLEYVVLQLSFSCLCLGLVLFKVLWMLFILDE